MKKIAIGIIAVLVLILGGMYLANSGQQAAKEEEIPVPTIALPTVTDSIQVDFEGKSGGKEVSLAVRGLTPDMQSIEYDINFMTGEGLPRGILGKIQLKGEKEIVRDDLVLGTCSSGSCEYYTGVKDVNVILKFNTASGASVFQKTYPLE